MMENSEEKKRREKMTRKKKQFRRMVYRSREGKRGSRRVSGRRKPKKDLPCYNVALLPSASLAGPALLACGRCDEGIGGQGGPCLFWEREDHAPKQNQHGTKFVQAILRPSPARRREAGSGDRRGVRLEGARGSVCFLSGSGPASSWNRDRI
ncbi:unnamed protein product [Calypogeia fissa]